MAFNLEHIKKQNSASEMSKLNLKNILEKEISLFGTSFNNKKKEAFYTELGVLLNAGILLKDALNLMLEELKVKERFVFQRIVDDLILGMSFSDTIKMNKQFSEYEYFSLKIGEETGTLTKVTNELGLFFRRKNEQKKNLMNAISYPIVVLITALLAVFFMLRYVVPMFADIFKQNGVDLPVLTKVIIKSSELMQQYFWIFILFLVGMIFVKKIIQNKTWFKDYNTRLILKIPFVGDLIRKTYIAQFTQAIALLVGAKLPILNGIQLTKKMIDFYPLQIALTLVEKSILNGELLSKSLQPHSIFDRKMISLIKVAEETNQNEYIFERLTIQYNDEIQYKSKMLSTVLEPVIIIVLGALVAVILIAMYLPMFKLSSVLG